MAGDDRRGAAPAAAPPLDAGGPDGIGHPIRETDAGFATLPFDEIDRRAAGGPALPQRLEGPLETACAWLCCLGLMAMALLTAAEVFARAIFNYSFEITDDLAGYTVAGITFLSLAVCQVRHSFHHIEFVQGRLSPRARAWSGLAFTLVSIVFVGVLTWQLVLFDYLSYRSGDVSATSSLTVPMWIPQSVMPIGSAILLYALVKTGIAQWRAIRRGSPPGPDRQQAERRP